MQYKTFKELRENNKLSQRALAQQLYVNEKMIQKWEKGEAIPDFAMMSTIAEIFSVPLKDIISLFKPEEDAIDEREAMNEKMYQLLIELFEETDDFSLFSRMARLFNIEKGLHGIIRNEHTMFPFTNFFVSTDEYVVFLDKHNNAIPFTRQNVIDITPWNHDYDIYTFRIELTCPVLKHPDKEKMTTHIVYVSFIANR